MTKELPDNGLNPPPAKAHRAELRGKAADVAWKAISADKELERFRQRVSVHEIRLLVGHVLDAAFEVQS